MKPLTPTMVSTGIRGLDLALGGGVQRLARAGKERESAVILLRGAAGTGKTILALHLAHALAVARQSDIAYLCTELVPEELATSASAFAATRALTVLEPDDFPRAGPYEGTSRIFYAMESINAGDDAGARLDDAMPGLLDAVEHHVGAPASVLVVDALTDGYQLGAGVARQVADGAAKLAVERGVCMILVEEAIDTRPSPWSFAVDTVLELALHPGETVNGMGRTLTVVKHRFGWCDAGPHELYFDGDRLEVFPRAEAFLRAPPLTGDDVEVQRAGEARTWSPKWLRSSLPGPVGKVIGVWGTEAEKVRALALRLIEAEKRPQIEFDLRAVWSEEQRDLPRETSGAPDYLMRSHRMVASMLWRLQAATTVKQALGCVVVGDLYTTLGLRDLAGFRSAVRALAKMLSQAGVPLILYQTAPPRLFARTSARVTTSRDIHRVGDSPEPFVVEFANLTIELIENHNVSILAQVSDRDSRRSPITPPLDVPAEWW